jgi:hypothetical protein
MSFNSVILTIARLKSPRVRQQPDEHELQLARGSLLELDEALISMHGTPKIRSAHPLTSEAYKKRVDQQRAEMWDHDKSLVHLR